MNWHVLIIRGSAAKADIANSTDYHTYSLTAKYVRARYQYSSDTKVIGSSPCISIFLSCWLCRTLTNTKLLCAV